MLRNGCRITNTKIAETKPWPNSSPNDEENILLQRSPLAGIPTVIKNLVSLQTPGKSSLMKWAGVNGKRNFLVSTGLL